MQQYAQPKISIIIPIYNVEQYLSKTLTSILEQSLKDIEIICVEDCSTDASAQILNTFAVKDSRIRIIQHTQNQGVSIARKNGILASSGEYIMFVDGDDSLEKNACNELYQQIQKDRSDILQFATNINPIGDVNEDEIVYLENLLKPYDAKLEARNYGDLTNACFADEKFGYTLWNKIYSGDIVRQAVVHYSDDRFNMSEDLYLFFLISFFAKTYSSSTEKYYNYNFGAGITGGAALNEKAFKNKVAQGRILKHIKQFTDNYDDIDNTLRAQENIKQLFISDVIYNLVWRSESIDSKKIFADTLEAFPQEDVLSELLDHYYSGNGELQKNIVKMCQAAYMPANNKKNIKTVGTFYYRINNGGIERVLSKLIPIWIAAGYRVVLFTDEPASNTDYSCPEEVTRVVVPCVKDKEKVQYHQRIHFWQHVISEYQIDVMVYHAWVSEYLLLDLMAIKSAGSAFVAHTHSFFAYGMKSASTFDKTQSILINYIYSLCDAIVTLSKADYSWWALRFDHVYRVVNPPGLDYREIIPSNLDSKNVLWLGRISPEKKPIDALKIIKRVKELGCNAQLHIVGKADDTAYEREFLKTISQLGLNDAVVLHGFHTDVTPFYENAALYLHTSDFEGFSMTIIESKIYGLPAVLYDLPNLDSVNENKGMIVVKQNDIESAAQNIMMLLQNDAKRKQLGSDARESVEELYAVDIAQLWKSIFSDLAVQRKPEKEELELERLKVSIDLMLDFMTTGDSRSELEAIYNMRTWKLIEKYRKFMDTTTIGKYLRKIRDSLIK